MKISALKRNLTKLLIAAAAVFLIAACAFAFIGADGSAGIAAAADEDPAVKALSSLTDVAKINSRKMRDFDFYTNWFEMSEKPWDVWTDTTGQAAGRTNSYQDSLGMRLSFESDAAPAGPFDLGLGLQPGDPANASGKEFIGAYKIPIKSEDGLLERQIDTGRTYIYITVSISGVGMIDRTGYIIASPTDLTPGGFDNVNATKEARQTMMDLVSAQMQAPLASASADGTAMTLGSQTESTLIPAKTRFLYVVFKAVGSSSGSISTLFVPKLYMGIGDNAAPEVTDFFSSSTQRLEQLIEELSETTKYEPATNVKLDEFDVDKKNFNFYAYRNKAITFDQFTIAEQYDEKYNNAVGLREVEFQAGSVAGGATEKIQITNKGLVALNENPIQLKDSSGKIVCRIEYVSHTLLDGDENRIGSVSFKITVYSNYGLQRVRMTDMGGTSGNISIKVTNILQQMPVQYNSLKLNGADAAGTLVGPLVADKNGNITTIGTTEYTDSTSAKNALDGLLEGISWQNSKNIQFTFNGGEGKSTVFRYNVYKGLYWYYDPAPDRTEFRTSTVADLMRKDETFDASWNGYVTVATDAIDYTGNVSGVHYFIFKIDCAPPSGTVASSARYNSTNSYIGSYEYGSWTGDMVRITLSIEPSRSGVKVFYSTERDGIEKTELVPNDSTIKKDSHGYYIVPEGSGAKMTFTLTLAESKNSSGVYEEYNAELYFSVENGAHMQAGVADKDGKRMQFKIDRNAPHAVTTYMFEDYKNNSGIVQWLTAVDYETDANGVPVKNKWVLKKIQIEGFDDEHMGEGGKLCYSVLPKAMGGYYSIPLEDVDRTSGVIDFKLSSAPNSFTTAGLFPLSIWSVDQAGNESAVTTYNILIDPNVYRVEIAVDQWIGQPLIAEVALGRRVEIKEEYSDGKLIYYCEFMRGEIAAITVTPHFGYAVYGYYKEKGSLVSLETLSGNSFTLNVAIDDGDVNNRNTPPFQWENNSDRNGKVLFDFRAKRLFNIVLSDLNVVYNGEKRTAAATPSIDLGSSDILRLSYYGVMGMPGNYSKGGVLPEAPKDAGIYFVEAKCAENPIYIAEAKSALFTISQARITVTARPVSRTYDGSTVSALGEVSVGSDGNITCSETPTSVIVGGRLIIAEGSAKNAGTYHITQAPDYRIYVRESGDMFLQNYYVEFVGAEYVISKARIDITADSSDSNALNKDNFELDFIYDGFAPPVLYDGGEFFKVYGAEIGNFSETLKVYFAHDGVNAGTYPVKISEIIPDEGVVASNYEISLGVDLKLKIDKKTLRVKPLSAAKVYGDSDPAIGYAVNAEDLVGNDGASVISAVSFSRRSGESVGFYEYTGFLTCSVVNPNYKPEFDYDSDDFGAGIGFEIKQRLVTVIPYSGQWMKEDSADEINYYYTGYPSSMSDKREFSGNLAADVDGLITIGTLTSANFLITFTEGVYITIIGEGEFFLDGVS
ncbi:MAG: hypothetical protein LBC13_02460, partial [Clostridiales bacterium]|nr:hypothetical protein [Clostridiales bacterium]